MGEPSFMGAALAQAKDAATAAEVPVGCVIVRAGTIIAKDTHVNSDPEVTFELDRPAELAIVVINPSDTAADVALAVLEK